MASPTCSSTVMPLRTTVTSPTTFSTRPIAARGGWAAGGVAGAIGPRPVRLPLRVLSWRLRPREQRHGFGGQAPAVWTDQGRRMVGLEIARNDRMSAAVAEMEISAGAVQRAVKQQFSIGNMDDVRTHGIGA